MKQKVGVIGLGIMGSAMAKNLLKSGFPVAVYNRTPKKTSALSKAGAKTFKTSKELASACDVVIVIVTDPKAVWSVAEGPQGLLAATGHGKILIQSSTLDVATSLELAKKAQNSGYEFLDCPVTGSKKQAEEASLILEAGGDAKVLEKVRPILLSIGKHIVHAGPTGAGTALKLCMNLIVAQMTTGICESAALAKTLKLDPKHIFDVLEHSPALDCGYYRIKKEPLLSGQFPPAFSLANMLKDIRFMNQEAAKSKASLPVTEAVQHLMELASDQGLSDEDLTSIAKILPTK